MNDEDYLQAKGKEMLANIEKIIRRTPGATLEDIAANLGTSIDHPITAIGLNQATKLLAAEQGLIATWQEGTPTDQMTSLTAKYYFPKGSA